MPASRPFQTVLYRHFARDTNRLYRLYQEGGELPNLEISGIKMKSSTPSIEAVLTASLRELRPVRGECLDTCGGLGYSAIAMARAPAVTRVVCFEKDANVIEAARHNPASERLFSDPKIELRQADVRDGLEDVADGAFDRVFHDPPRVTLAGELYSFAFYKTLLRVLKPGGLLFHYTGAPGEKAGKRTRAGVMRRLTEAGFASTRDCPEAQGVAARRPRG